MLSSCGLLLSSPFFLFSSLIFSFLPSLVKLVLDTEPKNPIVMEDVKMRDPALSLSKKRYMDVEEDERPSKRVKTGDEISVPLPPSPPPSVLETKEAPSTQQINPRRLKDISKQSFEALAKGGKKCRLWCLCRITPEPLTKATTINSESLETYLELLTNSTAPILELKLGSREVPPPNRRGKKH
jgi:hypothetical protein